VAGSQGLGSLGDPGGLVLFEIPELGLIVARKGISTLNTHYLR